MTESRLEELSIDECLGLLRANAVGRIGFVTDDLVMVLPVNYRVVEATGITPGRWLAIRTRPGNVIDRAALDVAFEIDGVDASSQQGWSVLVRGTLHRVDPGAAASRERFDSEPWLAAERDAWFVIEPLAITGRRLHATDAEWAFAARGYI